MTSNALLENLSDLTTEDYVVVGVATCFRRQESELETLKVLEPVPSAYLETLLQGIPTAYDRVIAVTIGDLLESAKRSALIGDEDVRLCENFRDRVAAAARTYQNRPAAQALIPVGTTRTDLNFSTEKKRVLNFENVVKAEDNVRQHEYTHKTL
jgi:hypothetical protein